MPEANNPMIKTNAPGANCKPPEIARPLVQPPAIAAPYSIKMPAKKATTQRLGQEGPKICYHCSSAAKRHLKSPDSLAETKAPRNTPINSQNCQVMPGVDTNW